MMMHHNAGHPPARLVVGLLLLLCLTVSRPSSAAAGEKPREGPTGRLRIIELEGTPYEMGLTHGRALKAEIRVLVERWKSDLEKTYGVTAEAFIRGLLKKTDFKPAIERWTPGLLDEVRGIADGSGLDFDTVYAYQLIDEIWAIGPDLGFAKCTSIASWNRSGSPVYVAQDLDIPVFYHGFQTVLRIHDRERGLETLVFTIPGVLAANGLNNRSVGVCVNSVTALAYSAKGLPVDFVVRGILCQGTYEQAVAFLRDIQPAAPQNYVIGGPQGAASFERSASKMAAFSPFEGARFTFHTNHPRVNDDLNPSFAEGLRSSGRTIEEYGSKCPRFAFLSRVLKDNTAVIDLSRLKTILSDRASRINNSMTYGCTIMVLGDKPELHIAAGRPDKAPFQVLTFSPGHAR